MRLPYAVALLVPGRARLLARRAPQALGLETTARDDSKNISASGTEVRAALASCATCIFSRCPVDYGMRPPCTRQEAT